MKTLTQGTSEELPRQLPPAGAFLYGYVDTTIAGYRTLRHSATTYTLASGNYRGDELAAAITSAGLAASFSNGIFSLGAAASSSMIFADRLGYLLGIVRTASGNTMGITEPHVSSRISPVAIPLAGFVVRLHEIKAEDEQISDRLQRDIGYVYGAARVLTIEATMHKWSLAALLEGWCMTGRVSFMGPILDTIEPSTPEGSAAGVRILSVAEPVFIGQAQLWATVTFTVALEES